MILILNCFMTLANEYVMLSRIQNRLNNKFKCFKKYYWNKTQISTLQHL